MSLRLLRYHVLNEWASKKPSQVRQGKVILKYFCMQHVCSSILFVYLTVEWDIIAVMAS